MKDNAQNPIAKLFAKDKEILSVSQLSRKIKQCLESNIGYVWVTGEISSLRIPVSGHHYFLLKDESAQIKCVLWAATAKALNFALKEGTEVVVFGRVSVYDKGGDYQIVIDRIEPKGLGAQQLALIQLKEKLQKEGLFDVAHKKPIPFLPSVIGVITSPTGAAIKDILNIINRRFPDIHVIIYPVKVQGAEAEAEIVEAFKKMNELNNAEVLILARGGGSTEDLSLFNSEAITRAIYDSALPVISAIGHEIDITIADMVADRRAATPSEAAELVVPVKGKLIEDLDKLEDKLTEGLKSQLKMARLKLDGFRDSYALQQPFEMMRQYQQRLDEFFPRLTKGIKLCNEKGKQKAGDIANRLEALSPLKVLGRGYSITTNAQTAKIIRSIKDVKKDDLITTKLIDGSFSSKVTGTV
jgi:exodeoxyribonuclease VII large subunit